MVWALFAVVAREETRGASRYSTDRLAVACAVVLRWGVAWTVPVVRRDTGVARCTPPAAVVERCGVTLRTPWVGVAVAAPGARRPAAAPVARVGVLRATTVDARRGW